MDWTVLVIAMLIAVAAVLACWAVCDKALEKQAIVFKHAIHVQDTCWARMNAERAQHVKQLALTVAMTECAVKVAERNSELTNCHLNVEAIRKDITRDVSMAVRAQFMARAVAETKHLEDTQMLPKPGKAEKDSAGDG